MKLSVQRTNKEAMTPRISVSATRAAYVGPGLHLTPHRNSVATIAIALDAHFELTAPYPGHPVRHQIAIIPPHVKHHLVANGPIAFLYLDALCDDYEQVQTMDLAIAAGRIRQAGANAVDAWDVDAFWCAFGVAPPVAPHLLTAIRALEERPQSFKRVAELAAIAGLSPSRFQAVFVEATGMPFRRYRNWRRMAVVIRALAEGSSLTQAGLDAGFSGSAHLSTAFRAMFGLAPSALSKHSVQLRVADGSHVP